MLIWLKVFLLVLTAILSCAGTGNVCASTNEPGVKYFDIRLPETEVPTELTSYVCQAQQIPLSMGVAYHAVAFEPIIMNKDVMHHMILFGCQNAISNDPHGCGGEDAACKFFLVQWSMGIQGQICSYPNTGVRFGLDSFHSLSLQIHWNNAKVAKGLSDSSGVRVYYTTHLRRYDAGNVQVGQDDLQIPPGVAHFAQTGSCSSTCTRQLLQEPIYLTRAHVHLHYVGDGGILELVRNGQHVKTIVNDTEFDYNNPPWHYFDDPVQVLPGDELKLTCFYNTRDGVKYRNNTIYWDEGSTGEMCYAFITYYPSMPNLVQCIQFDKYDICGEAGRTSVGGCSFGGFTHSFQTFLAEDILTQCTRSSNSHMRSSASQQLVDIDKPLLCSDKCEKVRQTMTEHPCMQNRLGQHLRRVYLPTVDSWEKVKAVLEAARRYCID